VHASSARISAMVKRNEREPEGGWGAVDVVVAELMG